MKRRRRHRHRRPWSVRRVTSSLPRMTAYLVIAIVIAVIVVYALPVVEDVMSGIVGLPDGLSTATIERLEKEARENARR